MYDWIVIAIVVIVIAIVVIVITLPLLLFVFKRIDKKVKQEKGKKDSKTHSYEIIAKAENVEQKTGKESGNFSDEINEAEKIEQNTGKNSRNRLDEIRNAQKVELHAGDKLKTMSGGVLTVTEELDRGSQGIVYKVKYKDKDDKECDKALKWYFERTLLRSKDFYNNLQNNSAKGCPDPIFLWPEELTEYDENGFGYIMNIKPDKYKILSEILNTDWRTSEFDVMIRRINAAISIANGFNKLHARGLSYQDISSLNIFVDPENADVLIFDCDNVAANERNFTNIKGTVEFWAPEIVRGDKRCPDIHTDRFSLAVLIYRLLFSAFPLDGKMMEVEADQRENIFAEDPVFVFDPDDKRNRPILSKHTTELLLWWIYPEFIHDICIRSFSKASMIRQGSDLEHRVLEEEWIDALTKLKGLIFKCPQCGKLVSINQMENYCAFCRKEFEVPMHDIALRREGKMENKKIVVKDLEGVEPVVIQGMNDYKDGPVRNPMILFFVVDCSGSMDGEKIGTVNVAIERTIPELVKISQRNTDAFIKVATLCFATGAEWINEPIEVENKNFRWKYLGAQGVTDLGEALLELDEKLSDKNFMGESVCYAPVIFLMSDGEPTDNYKDALKKLKRNKLFKSATKVALAIGDNANVDILSDFTGDGNNVVSVGNDKAALETWIKFLAIKSSTLGSRTTVNLNGVGINRNKEMAEEIVKEKQKYDGKLDQSERFNKKSY